MKTKETGDYEQPECLGGGTLLFCELSQEWRSLRDCIREKLLLVGLPSASDRLVKHAVWAY